MIEAKMREICTCPLTGRTTPPEPGIGDPGRARSGQRGDCVRRDDCRGCRRGRVTERTVTGVLREIGGRERRCIYEKPAIQERK